MISPSEKHDPVYLESHILLEHALQLIHLLAHARQGPLQFRHLHLPPLPVPLLSLLVLQLLPWCAVRPAQRACIHDGYIIDQLDYTALRCMPWSAADPAQRACMHDCYTIRAN